jgi:hypothetical protein
MMPQVIVWRFDHSLCWKSESLGDLRISGFGTFRGAMAPSPEYHLPTMIFQNFGKISLDGSHAIARATPAVIAGQGGAGSLARCEADRTGAAQMMTTSMDVDAASGSPERWVPGTVARGIGSHRETATPQAEGAQEVVACGIARPQHESGKIADLRN